MLHSNEPKKAVVALGMFDGMHIGHTALVRRTAELARASGALAVVDTFENHPAEVLGLPVQMLSNADERIARMRAAGADEILLTRFTREEAAKSPEQFITEILACFRVEGFVTGFNYTFGQYGLGTPETLRTLGAQYGFFTETVPPVLYRCEPVSSTRIRTALENGFPDEAADMLGYPYALSGPVIENRRIGRRIGFPTANIPFDQTRVLPKSGVYATEATLIGRVYPAVTNIGTNPTVGGDRLSIETHLIGFSGDAYGQPLTVRFLQRLRGETTFENVDALKRQIAQDVEAAKRIIAATAAHTV